MNPLILGLVAVAVGVAWARRSSAAPALPQFVPSPTTTPVSASSPVAQATVRRADIQRFQNELNTLRSQVERATSSSLPFAPLTEDGVLGPRTTSAYDTMMRMRRYDRPEPGPHPAIVTTAAGIQAVTNAVALRRRNYWTGVVGVRPPGPGNP